MGRRAVLALVGLLLGTGPVAAQVEVVEYYATDAVGSVRVVFNEAGQVVARADYPFDSRPTIISARSGHVSPSASSPRRSGSSPRSSSPDRRGTGFEGRTG